MRKIEVEERRARLGLRHHLAGGARAAGVEAAADDMVGLHASDPVTAYLSARARCPATTADIDEALYERRSLLRILGMRRTLFMAPIPLACLVQEGAANRLISGERRRAAAMIESGGIADDGGTWLKTVEEATLAALRARGHGTARELAREVPELGLQITFGEGKKWSGSMGVSTRVLFLLALEGRVGRGRPRGSWTSSQHRWEPIEAWAPGGLVGPGEEGARVQIVASWLRTFGPGTIEDLRWWSGWNLAEIRQALSSLDVCEVEVDGGVGLVLAADEEPAPVPDSWVALLPALDATPMGWKARDWYLGPHRTALFDRNGNIGPTVWHDGRVIGGWGQTSDRKVVYRLLEDPGRKASRRIDREVRDLEEWIGGARITPRFRTPLEIELGA